MNVWHYVGIVEILLGLLYRHKPNLFRRGIWMKTSMAIRTLSPEGYVKYMRGLGATLILIGIGCFVYGFFAPTP